MLGRNIHNHWLMVALDHYRRKELSSGIQEHPPMRMIKRYIVAWERKPSIVTRLLHRKSNSEFKLSTWIHIQKDA